MNDIETTKSQQDQDYFEKNGVYPVSDDSLAEEDKVYVTEEELAGLLATQYQWDRNYPPIGDQLDALFHAGVFPQEMADKIKAVKDAHPKPTEDII
jgi:hypothetical protein